MSLPPSPRRPLGRRAERVRAEAYTDGELLGGMRDGDAWAWSEFYARFRPVLAAYARRAGASPEELEACVDEVLADQGARLTGPGTPLPAQLAAYLLRATRHRLLNARRASARRQRHYADAAETQTGEAVVVPLVSEYLRRVSEGVDDTDDASSERRGVQRDAAAHGSTSDAIGAAGVHGASGTVMQLALHLRAVTTDEERLLLTWVAEGVPHRTIASWLGVRYDAATKRIWRLCQKLRGVAVRYATSLPAEDRAELSRFLRRAGALPPLVLPSLPSTSEPPTTFSYAPEAGRAGREPDGVGRPSPGRRAVAEEVRAALPAHSTRSEHRVTQAGDAPAAPDPTGARRRGSVP